MKRGLVVILLTLLVLGAVWLCILNSRKPTSQTATDFDAKALPVSARAIAGRDSAASANPENSEQSPASESMVDQSLPPAVLPTPTARALAAAEELPPGPEAGEANSSLPPASVLENMRTAFRQYQLRFRENPVGDNAEITRALNGGNPGQVTFIQPDDGLRLNARGELVDNWGTPYFFHQLSRSEMEIRSAGADRRMWTTDDLVLK